MTANGVLQVRFAHAVGKIGFLWKTSHFGPVDVVLFHGHSHTGQSLNHNKHTSIMQWAIYTERNQWSRWPLLMNSQPMDKLRHSVCGRLTSNILDEQLVCSANFFEITRPPKIGHFGTFNIGLTQPLFGFLRRQRQFSTARGCLQ